MHQPRTDAFRQKLLPGIPGLHAQYLTLGQPHLNQIDYELARKLGRDVDDPQASILRSFLTTVAILINLDLLRKRTPPDPVAKRLIDNAFEGAQRGDDFNPTHTCLRAPTDLKVDRVDLPQLLAGMSDLVKRSIGPEWPISTNLPLGLPAIRADANQLEMALLNLIVNARDATPSGGPILVAATLEDVSGLSTLNPSPGNYVRLAFKDHGSGMDEDILRREDN
jgi:signal transduction histidine kinase